MKPSLLIFKHTPVPSFLREKDDYKIRGYFSKGVCGQSQRTYSFDMTE